MAPETKPLVAISSFTTSYAKTFVWFAEVPAVKPKTALAVPLPMLTKDFASFVGLVRRSMWRCALTPALATPERPGTALIAVTTELMVTDVPAGSVIV